MDRLVRCTIKAVEIFSKATKNEVPWIDVAEFRFLSTPSLQSASFRTYVLQRKNQERNGNRFVLLKPARQRIFKLKNPSNENSGRNEEPPDAPNTLVFLPCALADDPGGVSFLNILHSYRIIFQPSLHALPKHPSESEF